MKQSTRWWIAAVATSCIGGGLVGVSHTLSFVMVLVGAGVGGVAAGKMVKGQ